MHTLTCNGFNNTLIQRFASIRAKQAQFPMDLCVTAHTSPVTDTVFSASLSCSREAHRFCVDSLMSSNG